MCYNWAERILGKQSGLTGRVPRPYMMHMLVGGGRNVGARRAACAIRSDVRVSGEYATKGLMGERIDTQTDRKARCPALTAGHAQEVKVRAHKYTHALAHMHTYRRSRLSGEGVDFTNNRSE